MSKGRRKTRNPRSDASQKRDWAIAARKLLIRRRIPNVKIEPLATSSFYWRFFTGRQALHGPRRARRSMAPARRFDVAISRRSSFLPASNKSFGFSPRRQRQEGLLRGIVDKRMIRSFLDT